MCGIFGVINTDLRPASDSADIVRKGIELLHHRGPDGSGVEANGPVCLGHARLSIIDLAGGAQPMWSSKKDGFVSFNGEIYNFRDLRQELEEAGHTFQSRSDTEVLINAYLEWGPDCVRRLRGMFAFAAVDLRKNTVLIARDRLGIKPVYYTIRDGQLAFSSELEALYQTFGPFQVDLDALDDYLYWQYIHAPRTIYRNVRQLPPAHYIEIDLKTGNVLERKYWEVHFREDRSLGLDEWTERLDSAVREAVEIRLVSDVPFGAFLSGGIDSSVVVGYMSEILDQPVKTFSIGFKEADFSELKYAEQVARINHTEHHTEIVEADSFGLLPLLVRHYGQPFADSSAIPTYYVSKMARKHVKMVLSGDGGDENFAGYNSYETVCRLVFAESFRGRKPLKERLKMLLLYFLTKWKGQSDSIIDMAYNAHVMTAQHFNPDERRKLFRQEYKDAVRDHVPHRRALMEIGNQPLISRLQHLDLMAYLPFDILTKVDVASMANSLEARVPLLDHVLVETAATIPAELKLREDRRNGDCTYDKKFILKRLALRRYPEEIIERPKMGFGIPLGRWFAGSLREEVAKRLLQSDHLKVLFETHYMQTLLNRHSEKNDLTTKLWNLLFLEEWMRSHEGALRGL